MRTTWMLVGLLGCGGQKADPAAAKPAPAAASAKAPRAAEPASSAPNAREASSPRPGKAKSKARSSGNVPRTVPSGLSKADRDARMVARCTDGNVVFGFWQGEYPSPVVQLDRPLRTKVRTDPCGGTVEKGCTAPAGLYHPWAQDTDRPAGIEFAVRTMPETWRLAKPHSLGGTALKAGTTVEVLTYLSEGFCTMVVDGQVLEDMCPGTQPGSGTWKRVSPERPASTQLIKVQCDGGSTGWLTVDDAFMQQSGVREGEMQGYGEVAPAR